MVTFFDSVLEDTDLYSIPQVFRRTVPVAPLRPGEKAPLFSIQQQRLVGQYITWHNHYSKLIQLHDWLQNGPLVVSFYHSGWNGYAGTYLQKLAQLYGQIRQLGGNLLVLANDSIDSLQEQVEQPDLPFTIAQDVDNYIAGKFGVHSTDDPVWNRIAGITEDVPFPALFAVAPNREILFSYVDRDFEGAFPGQEVVSQLEEQSVAEVVNLYERSAA